MTAIAPGCPGGAAKPDGGRLMRKAPILMALVAVVALALAPAQARSQGSTLDKASRLIRAEKYDDAIALLKAFTSGHPDNGPAWATLANAYHMKGDYESAVAMNRRAAEFPGVRQTALYNEACGLSLMGNVEKAHEMLLAALGDGFLDYDLLARDTDLEAVRAEYDVPMPKTHEYETMKARNGIELGYRVVLPADYDAGNFYPALVLFPPGSGTRSADWAMDELVGDGDTNGWVVVYPIAPEQGWFTHPSHHAFNDLLRQLQSEVRIEGGKFHLAGFGSGARAATSYSQMSREYFQTLTSFSGWHWASWDNDEVLAGFSDLPVRLIVGEQDDFGLPLNERLEGQMSGEDVNVGLTILEGDNQLLASMRHGKLLDYIPREAGMLNTSW